MQSNHPLSRLMRNVHKLFEREDSGIKHGAEAHTRESLSACHSLVYDKRHHRNSRFVRVFVDCPAVNIKYCVDDIAKDYPKFTTVLDGIDLESCKQKATAFMPSDDFLRALSKDIDNCAMDYPKRLARQLDPAMCIYLQVPKKYTANGHGAELIYLTSFGNNARLAVVVLLDPIESDNNHTVYYWKTM